MSKPTEKEGDLTIPNWANQKPFSDYDIVVNTKTHEIFVNPKGCPELVFKYTTVGKKSALVAGALQLPGFIDEQKEKIATYKALKNEALECNFTFKRTKTGFTLTANDETTPLPTSYDSLREKVSKAVEAFLLKPYPVPAPPPPAPFEDGVLTHDGIEYELQPEKLRAPPPASKIIADIPDSVIFTHLQKENKIKIPARALQNAIIKYFTLEGDTRERDDFIKELAYHASNYDSHKLNTYDKRKTNNARNIEHEYRDFMSAALSGVGTPPKPDDEATGRIINAMAQHLSNLNEHKLDSATKRFSENIVESFREDMQELIQTLNNHAERRAR